MPDLTTTRQGIADDLKGVLPGSATPLPIMLRLAHLVDADITHGDGELGKRLLQMAGHKLSDWRTLRDRSKRASDCSNWALGCQQLLPGYDDPCDREAGSRVRPELIRCLEDYTSSENGGIPWSKPMTIGEVAGRFGIHRNTAARWLKDKQIECRPHGSLWMIDTREIPKA